MVRCSLRIRLLPPVGVEGIALAKNDFAPLLLDLSASRHSGVNVCTGVVAELAGRWAAPFPVPGPRARAAGAHVGLGMFAASFLRVLAKSMPQRQGG